jgi:hypothetical protein
VTASQRAVAWLGGRFLWLRPLPHQSPRSSSTRAVAA